MSSMEVDLCPDEFSSLDDNSNEDNSSAPQIKVECQWSQCSQVFADCKQLIEHLTDSHIDRANPVCLWDDCPYGQRSFQQLHRLMYHLRTHTGEKPFKCTHEGCGRAFSRIDNMRTHLRSHTGEKPYECHRCGRAFTYMSQQISHMKSHSRQTTAQVLGSHSPIPPVRTALNKVQSNDNFEFMSKRLMTKKSTRPALDTTSTVASTRPLTINALKCTVNGCLKLYIDQNSLLRHMCTDHRMAPIVTSLTTATPRVRTDSPKVFKCLLNGCGQQFSEQTDVAVLLQHFQKHNILREVVDTRSQDSNSLHNSNISVESMTEKTRQVKNTNGTISGAIRGPVESHRCSRCGKTFKKLMQLNDHIEVVHSLTVDNSVGTADDNLDDWLFASSTHNQDIEVIEGTPERDGNGYQWSANERNAVEMCINSLKNENRLQSASDVFHEMNASDESDLSFKGCDLNSFQKIFKEMGFRITENMIINKNPLSASQRLCRKVRAEWLCQWPDCSKTFKKRVKCVEHVRTHTGEKPFHCRRAGCHIACTQYGNLLLHLKRYRH